MTTDIIDLSPDDAYTCAAVAEALHRAFYSTKSFKETLARVTSAARDSLVLVAVTVTTKGARRVVGTLTLRRTYEHGELHAGDLYVVEEERKHGVGTLLAGHGIARCKSDFGADRVYAQVDEGAGRWLIDFYERLGFLLVSPSQRKYVMYL